MGAISVNLGACTFNKRLGLRGYEHLIMGGTFLVLALVEVTIAKTKPDALFFAVCVLGVGLGFRAYSHKIAGLKTLTLTAQSCRHGDAQPRHNRGTRIQEGHRIMVAARGITSVLGFALDEAQLRNATLYVLYVKEIVVFYARGPTVPGRPKWQDDPEAAAIMSTMVKLGAERNVRVLPVYAVSETRRQLFLILRPRWVWIISSSAPHSATAMSKLLRGSVVTNVAQQLPESII